MSEKNQVTRRAFIKGAAVAGAVVASGGALNSLAPTPAMAAGVPDKWDKEVDVVIVGSGHAGLATAITAVDAGAKVVVLEKMKKDREGGNSKVSGNMWWTPTDTQQAVTYMKALAFDGLTDDASIQALAAKMLVLNDWLKPFGVKPTSIAPTFQPEHPELPGSDTVRTWGDAQRLVLNADKQPPGATLYNPIRAAVDKRNVEFMYETPAKDLVQGPTGEILGVRADSGGKTIAIKAKKGVVLCCGGFEFDPTMQKQFLPAWPIYGQGTPGNTGDGIKMAIKAGAMLWHMNNPLAGIGGMVVPEYAPVVIPVAMPANSFIYVDQLGQRFMSETRPSRHGFGQKEYLFFFDGVIGKFTRLPCFVVFDDATRLKGPIQSMAGRDFGWFNTYSGYKWSKDNSAEVTKGWILKGDTIADLAGKMKVDPKALQATLDKYNGFVKNKADPDFGRTPDSMLPMDKGPYYAVQLYPTMVNTQGGPKRNAKCQIVDPNDQPIARLYSAGEIGSFWGWMYNGGGNNAECLCTGQIAGANVVAEKPWDAST